MSSVSNHSLSCDTESEVFLQSTKHVHTGCWWSRVSPTESLDLLLDLLYFFPVETSDFVFLHTLSKMIRSNTLLACETKVLIL